MIKSIGFLFVFILNFSISFSQSGTILEIQKVEKEFADLKSKEKALQDKIEVLRLKRNREYCAQYGFPLMKDSGVTVFHTALALNYNEPCEQANWVAHIISPEIREGIITRSNDFREDPLVKTGTAQKDDYWYSGYDRGHLAPSADFKWSENALSESFYYSNMSPQKADLNRVRWAELEDVLRKFVESENKSLYVVTGGILSGEMEKIGKNEVCIPTRYFKVAMDFESNPKKGIAFILPNDYCKYPVMKYAVSIDSVEKITGINFYTKLNPTDENSVETHFDIKDWQPLMKEGNFLPMSDSELPKGAVNTVQAKDFIGKKATVCGRVVATKYNDKSGTTFINFDQKFPDQLFSISIWKNNLVNFPYVPHEFLMNKTVCVTGTLYDQKGIPSVNIVNGKAIELIE